MADNTSKSEATRKSIRQAFLRIEKGRPKIVEKGRKLSISSVAEEAGLSRGAIHNCYPDMADKIREATGKELRSQRDQKQKDLKAERAKTSELRFQVSGLRDQIAKLASLNATLTFENNELKAIVESRNVKVLRPKNG